MRIVLGLSAQHLNVSTVPAGIWDARDDDSPQTSAHTVLFTDEDMATFGGTKQHLLTLLGVALARVQALPDDRPDGTVQTCVDLTKRDEDGQAI